MGNGWNLELIEQTETYLEVYDDSEDENGGHEVHEVGQVLPVEGLSQSPHLVLAGGQQVEEGNHSTLELGSSASVHL